MCRPPTQDELEESEPSLARTFWRLRAVALVACCDEALFSFATGATHYPYLRTLVRCHARSSSFSGSARCGDADVVLKRGTSLGGWATAAVVVGTSIFHEIRPASSTACVLLSANGFFDSARCDAQVSEPAPDRGKIGGRAPQSPRRPSSAHAPHTIRQREQCQSRSPHPPHQTAPRSRR